MRSHAKAATAGSTKRLGKKSKPALLLCVLAAAVAALALVVGSASGATTRFLVETFGSSAQPTFPADRGMAFDQGASQLYVIDSTNDTISRFNANGTAADFSALGSNVIDGEGTGDETPLGHLAFESNRQREQIAIDESGGATDGNVYATRSASDVVDVFSASGEYEGTLSESTATGAFGEPCGVAVDGSGNVYVGDRGDDRIHVYEPAGAVPVNADNTASFATVTDPCTLAAGSAATAGFLFVNASTGAQLRKVDAATGEIKYEIATGASTVSVDPATGHVFAARNTGSSSSVDEYDASGAAEATLVSSFKPGSTVEGIAQNSAAEQVYVARSGTENVEVFGPAAVIPDVVTSPPSSNTGTRATLDGTVNPDGVELTECFFEWTQNPNSAAPSSYDNVAPCAETPAEIGTGTTPVAVHADINGLIPHNTRYHFRLVAANPNATINGANQNFTTPNTVITEAASAVTSTEATLNGSVNPDEASISGCVFEWGPEKGPLELSQGYPEAAPCVPGPGGIGTGTTPVAVSAALSGLHPGTSYVYRLKATYPTGPITDGTETVQTTGPVIEATWTEEVLFTEAILKTEINPEGSPTTYHFEYGETTAYGSDTPELNVGSDSSLHELSRPIDGLKPGTTYHYRVVSTSATAENVGPDFTLTTYRRLAPDTSCSNQSYRIGVSANLPDCRAYEMVSPVDKEGADIISRPNLPKYLTGMDQGAVDGSKVTYSSYKAFGDAQSSVYNNQYLASRGEDGWTTHGITPPRQASVNFFGSDVVLTPPQFTAFNDDLSIGYLLDDGRPTLLPNAVQDHYNLYQRDNLTGGYTALTTGSLHWPSPSDNLGPPTVMGHTDDGSHVIFTAKGGLTPDAPHNSNPHLYEYFNGGVRLVSVLPNGEAESGEAIGGRGGNSEHNGLVTNAISEDGSRIVWTAGSWLSGGRIYVRISGNTTVSVSQPLGIQSAQFWGASADGRKVVFTGGSSVDDLHVFDVDTETSRLVASEVRGVLGAGDDGEYVYFISDEALDGGARQGDFNVYVDHAGTKTFIGALPKVDIGIQSPDEGEFNVASSSALRHFTRVTPAGRYLVFQTRAKLTNYDSRAVNNDERAVEVYRYDSALNQLLCISCRPSGARPFAAPLNEPYYEEGNSIAGTKTVWAAAWINTTRRQTYFPRVVSSDGKRVFFNSFDALVPTDTNGVQDVYEWEAQGTGSCADVGGCVSLISTGRSPEPSEFIDASVNGDDVFFRTGASIDRRDQGLVDIYDARVGGGFPPPPPPPPACIGDACQAVPSAPKEQTPASATFRGAGNPLSSQRANRCSRYSKRAVRLRRKAMRAARRSRQVEGRKRQQRLRRRSRQLSRRASHVVRNAKRCRRANRRTGQ